jgi:hypothetical protein
MLSGQSLEILKTENIAYGFTVNFWGEDMDAISSILVNAFLTPLRGKKFVHAKKLTPEKQCLSCSSGEVLCPPQDQKVVGLIPL